MSETICYLWAAVSSEECLFQHGVPPSKSMCTIMFLTMPPSKCLFHFFSGGSFVSPPFLFSLVPVFFLKHVCTGSLHWSFSMKKIFILVLAIFWIFNLVLAVTSTGHSALTHRAPCHQNPAVYAPYISPLELEEGVSTITNQTYAYHRVHPSSLLTRLQGLTPQHTEQVSPTDSNSWPCQIQNQEYNG